MSADLKSASQFPRSLSGHTGAVLVYCQHNHHITIIKYCDSKPISFITSLHNRASAMIITLLLCRKDKSRYSLMLRSWDIFISTWIILITTGLIWRWLINLAHSSILSTFRALTWSYPELIVSVKCNFSASPIPDCLWLPILSLWGRVQVPGYRGWLGTCGHCHEEEDNGHWGDEEPEYGQYLGNNERALGILGGKVSWEMGRGLGRGKNSLKQGDVMSLISHQARCLGSDDLLSFFVNKKPAWNECLLIQTKY